VVEGIEVLVEQNLTRPGSLGKHNLVVSKEFIMLFCNKNNVTKNTRVS